MDLIQIMKALGDETRLRILNLLSQGELCVCELEQILDINQSNASRHLNKLTVSNLISYEKRALYVYYKLNDKVLKEYPFLIWLITKELAKIERCKEDLDRYDKYKSSGCTCEDIRKGCFCLENTKGD